eukprot:764396-Hanusia_phi.AAC.2
MFFQRNQTVCVIWPSPVKEIKDICESIKNNTEPTPQTYILQNDSNQLVFFNYDEESQAKSAQTKIKEWIDVHLAKYWGAGGKAKPIVYLRSEQPFQNDQTVCLKWKRQDEDKRLEEVCVKLKNDFHPQAFSYNVSVDKDPAYSGCPLVYFNFRNSEEALRAKFNYEKWIEEEHREMNPDHPVPIFYIKCDANKAISFALYLTNLNNADVSSLKTTLGAFGPLVQSNVLPSISKLNDGVFVNFVNFEDAEKALEACGKGQLVLQDGKSIIDANPRPNVLYIQEIRRKLRESGRQDMTFQEAAETAASIPTADSKFKTDNYLELLMKCESLFEIDWNKRVVKSKKEEPEISEIVIPQQVDHSVAANSLPTRARLEEGSPHVNYLRFSKLLHGVGRDVLAQVVQACYTKTSKRSWSREAGAEIAKGLDDYSQRKLGKPLMTTLRSEGIERWDITLLTSLLIFDPGYIKNEQRVEAVEILRAQRNQLAHSSTSHLHELMQGEFNERWPLVRESLNVLISRYLEQDQQLKLNEQINAIEIAADQSDQDDVADEIDAGHKALGSPRTQQERISLGNEWYTLLSKAGAGDMGTVHVARKDGTDERYALKICKNSGGLRQDRESVILDKLKALKHPNIVRFLGSSTVDGQLHLLMELIRGVSLDSWLKDQKRQGVVQGVVQGVSLVDAKKMMLQFADGMSAVHSYNIAHRDLKPSNLMLDEVTGNLVIVDFGLSKQLNANATVTTDTSVIGTAMYMSPEQVNGNTSEIDLRSDVWAMGVICYEIVAGRTPFHPGNGIMSKAEEMNMLKAILKSAMPELAADVAPNPFQQVLRKSLAKDKENRQKDAGEFSSELVKALEEIDNDKNKKEEERGGAAGQTKRSIESLSVEEVSKIFQDCKFEAAAEAIIDCKVDGKTYKLLDEEDFKRSIKDGGLGLLPMQKKRIEAQMKEYLNRVG